MTGAEVRAARIRLGRTQGQLARLAGIPEDALGNFERTGRMSFPMYGRQDRLAALRAALERLGVAFSDEGAAGTRLQKAAE